MMRSFAILAALASCVIPILATGGQNCQVVETITVQSGDTLGAIAGAKKLTVPQILAVNPQITNPDFIKIGDKVNIPNSTCVPDAKPNPGPKIPCSPKGAVNTYVVVSGDTMFIIAQRIGVSLETLIAANPQIQDPNVINIGDKINVPACPAATTSQQQLGTCSTGTKDKYTVVSGDTLNNIAEVIFKITLGSVIAANPQITNPDLIFPGQIVNIPLCNKTESAPCDATSTPDVAARDFRSRVVRRN